MKTIIKGISQKIYLDQATIGSGKTIYLNIVGEDGNYLTNNTGDELKSLQLIYDSDLQKYFYEVTINETEATQYIRLYFYSSEINVNSDYYPEDAYLDSNVLAPIAEIVPFGFFKEFYLNIRGKIDKSHQTIIDSYLADKKGLQNKLLSAQNKLELALEMFLTARDYIEKRDNYLEKLSQNFWQFQVSYPPIIELKEFKFKIGNADLVDIDNDMFTVNEQMGTIEFIPYPSEKGAGYFSYMIASMAGIGLAIHTVGGY